MATQIKRKVFDFHAFDYKSDDRNIVILKDTPNPKSVSAQPHNENNFIQRWYLSFQGDDSPAFSTTAVTQDGTVAQRIYRYDWTFGITVIENFWWDWMGELPNADALAIHVLLQPDDNAPEVMPISATLSALHPARNTKGILGHTLSSFLPTAATELKKLPLPGIQDFLSGGLTLTSNIIDSYREFQNNWFLYQFVDEKLKCPAIEWRINKGVLKEYGPLLRGSLYLAFHGSQESSPGKIRLKFRPQIRYSPGENLNFIVPTDSLVENEQIIIDVTPMS